MPNSVEYSQMLKELRKSRKALGKCTSCGTEDAYTMAGRAMCAECAARETESKKRIRHRSPEATQQYNARYRAHRQKWRAEGKCTRCARKLLGGDYAYRTCPMCRNYMRQQKAKRWREKGGRSLEEALSGDTCYFCKSPNVVPGKKLCQSCIEKRCKSLGLEKNWLGQWYRPQVKANAEEKQN